MTEITLYGDYIADKRLSMNIYAESIYDALKSSGSNARYFVPSSKFEYLSNIKSVMRYLRYFQYPRTIKKSTSLVHHVVDHGYAHLYPHLNAGKTCITAHDLIPFLSWKGVIEVKDFTGKRRIFRKPVLNLKSLDYLKNYNHIISISENTKYDLIEHLGISEDKISVVPPIISDIFQPASKKSKTIFRDKYDINSAEKLIVITGDAFYKNHQTSLRVIRQLIDKKYQVRMIKTGFQTNEFEKNIKHLGISNNVRSIFIEDSKDMATLYSIADCLLFPSLYEGFGMPVIEALSCGTPVVCSNSGALKEFNSSAVLKCDPYDVSQLTDNVEKLLFDTHYNRNLFTGVNSFVNQFRSKNVIPQLQTAYQNILK